MPFRTVEHTADVGIEVEGASLAELFADAARGLFEVVRGENVVRPSERREVEVEEPHLHHLLLEFLEAFIFLQDSEGLVFADVADVEVTGAAGAWRARCTVRGERFSHERHPGCIQVKAVTRHELSVTLPTAGVPARARVLFDI